MKQTILLLLMEFDQSGDGQIKRSELQRVMKDQNAIVTLVDLEVDLGYLKMKEELLYENRTDAPIDEIMDSILNSRGSLGVSVKHMVNGQECTRRILAKELELHARRIEEQLECLKVQLAMQSSDTIRQAQSIAQLLGALEGGECSI